MENKHQSLVFSSNIEAITECNSSFDKGILQVCYEGRNRNGSFISKETFEKCMPSIYNCPVVCNYDRETDTIGSHDIELVEDSEGRFYIANITHPVGVVPQGAKTFWKQIEDKSGVHDYLCTEVLLWKRQEAYRKIKEDGITDESMEITVKDGEMIDGIYVIKDFEFTAFCLLGTAEPCFESASLEVFSKNNFNEQLAEMMQEFKESFALTQSSQEVVIETQNNSEGGNKVLEQKISLLEEYNITAEALDFNLEDVTFEELKEKLESMKEPAQNNFELTEQFMQELLNALYTERVETCFGEMSRYYYVDCDIQAMEVYCYDTEDWKLYGLTYSRNGDNVVIDFESKKRKKTAIVDFDEGEQKFSFSPIVELMTNKFNENVQSWTEKYQEASDTISSMKNELDELRQFKTDTEKSLLKDKQDAVFAQFEDLIGVEAFENLRGNCKELSLEDIEEKCYAIRGRHNTQHKFSAEKKNVKLPVEKQLEDDEPYGGVFAEFGIKPLN